MSSGKSRGSRRPRDWSSQEKLEAVVEASGLEEEELGAFLRRQGLHEVQLAQWREDALRGLTKKGVKVKEQQQAKRRVKELERELLRKDAALAEAAALLVLQKKTRALWGDEDDSTAVWRGR